MSRQSTTDAGIAIACIVVFLAILGGITHKARAQEHEGHAAFHDVYKEWTVPGTTVPCCNAKRDPVTNAPLGGDCYHTIAEVRRDEDGNLAWRVRLDNGNWVEVPRSKIINELNPDDTGTRAHVCETITTRGGDGGILCFLPPLGGS